MCFLPFPEQDYVCLYNITRIVDLAEVARPQSYDWHLIYHICICPILDWGRKVIDFQISLGYQRQHCTISYAKWICQNFLLLFNCSKISPQNDKHVETPPKWQIKSNQWTNVVPAATAVNLKWIWKHQFKVNGHSRADNHFQGIGDLEDIFCRLYIFCTRSQRVAALVSQIQIKVRRATLSLTLT